MHIALSLPARGRLAVDGALRGRVAGGDARTVHEPDAPVRDGVARADYAIAAYPSNTFFLEQPSPKAVFTVSAGVGHVLRMPHLPARAARSRRRRRHGAADGALCGDRGDALRAAARHVPRPAARGHMAAAAAARARATCTCGVMGLGVIGSAIARALVAEGFAVRGYARARKSVEGVRCFAGRPRRRSSRASIFLVNVLPSTTATRQACSTARARAPRRRRARGQHRPRQRPGRRRPARADRRGQAGRRHARRVPRGAAAAVASVLVAARRSRSRRTCRA